MMKKLTRWPTSLENVFWPLKPNAAVVLEGLSHTNP